MSGDALLTLAVIVAVVVMMTVELLSPDILLLTALGLLVAAGVLELDLALDGFANPTLLTIGSLFVIAAGLRETGVLETAGRLLLGRTSRLKQTLLRLTTTTAAASAFMSNTAIVAMGIPLVRGWAGRRGLRPSKLLIPLSFSSMLGGLCTLIGTSTNLVSSGLLQAHGMPPLGFFELAAVGVPAAVVGTAYLVFVAPRLLPERKEVRTREERAKERTLEMELDPGSRLAGMSLEEADLEDQPGRVLVRIDRPGDTVAGRLVDERLREGDRLTFAGEDSELRSVSRRPGMHEVVRRTPVEGVGAEVHEVVVSEGSPLVGERIRDVVVPGRYNAAVSGVQRRGEPVQRELGQVTIRPGDTLLLSTAPGFREAFDDSLDFVVVSEAPSVRDRFLTDRQLPALGILAGVVMVMVLELLPVSLAALFGAVAIVALGCLSPGEARRAVDWSVLIVIGAALGLASALEVSGAASVIGETLVEAGMALGSTGILAAIFVAGMLFTLVITNNAAVAFMFPVALSAAQAQAVNPRPFLIAITVASSLAFATPLGYQTNLMVYGPGGYRFSDFARVGLPLQIAVAVVAIAVIQVAWPLGP